VKTSRLPRRNISCHLTGLCCITCQNPWTPNHNPIPLLNKSKISIDMRYIKSFLFLAVILVMSCSPKVGKETTSSGSSSGDFRSMAPKPGPARAIEIGTSTNFTLANGLKVIVVENHKLPQISYQLTIDRDPVLEKEKAGLADISGSLIATGTTTKT